MVKASDGTEHTLHFVRRTSVHGADAAATGTKDAFHGLKEGSEVVWHKIAPLLAREFNVVAADSKPVDGENHSN